MLVHCNYRGGGEEQGFNPDDDVVQRDIACRQPVVRASLASIQSFRGAAQ